MNIKYDKWNNVENSNIYLCSPGQGKNNILNGIDIESCSFTENLKDFNTISFTVNKYIETDGTRRISSGYNLIDVFKELYVDNIGRFVISTPPVISIDGEFESKEVSAKSFEYKLVYKNLTNFKINTGEYNSYERFIENNVDILGKTINPVTLYNSKNPKLSLLDILCNIAGGGWSVGHIDDDLKSKVCYFNIENKDIYSFIMQDMSKSFKCIFTFDTINKTINAYSENNIGEDTNVFISFRNLANSINISPYTENLYTRFTVRGSNNLDISQVNFGEDKIEDISYYLNTDFLPQHIINKYNTWKSYRESRREIYIQKMKSFISKQESRDEIINKIPCDSLNYDWDGFSKEELEKEKEYFSSLAACIENDFKNEQGIIDMDALKNSIYWWDYHSYITWILPNIETALQNADKIESEKESYNNTWKTNWELYGTKELEAIIKSYKEQVDATKDYEKPWEELAENEKSNYTGELAYNDIHNAYIKSSNDLEAATAKYNELISIVNNYQNEIDNINEQLTNIAADVSIRNSKFNFTNDELDILNNLYIDTDYTNENFFINSIYNQEDKIDEELLLLENALDQLSKESHPQYSFSCDLDNLFNIPEFKSWHGSFKTGNFIRLGISDTHYEKLRLISITFNPMVNNNDLKIEFSNMLTYNGKRSDLSSLFDESVSSSKNSISYGSSSKESNNNLDSTELLKYILNSRIVNDKIDSLKLNNLVTTEASIKNASVKFLKADELSAKVADFGYITAKEAVLKFADIEMTNVSTATMGKVFANTGLITSATIKDGHITGFLDSVEINANSITAGTLIADRLLLRGSENGLLYQLNNLGELTSGNLNSLDGNILTQRTVTADKLIAKSITANEIAAGTITADKLNVNNVSAAVANVINLDAAKITTGKISADRIDINSLFARQITASGSITSTGTYSDGTTFQNTISGGTFITHVKGEELARITSIKVSDEERYFSILADKAEAISIGVGAKGYYFMNNGGNPNGIAQRHQFVESVYIDGTLNINGGYLKVGSKVELSTNNEGGNIAWFAPDGTKWEFDCFNNDFRLFNYATYKNFIINKNGNAAFPGDLKVMGQLKTNGSSKIYAGTNVSMWTDNEGGNIEIISKSGAYGYQMDASSDNILRLYCFKTNPWTYLYSFNFDSTGNFRTNTLNGYSIGGAVAKNNNGLITGGNVYNALGNIQIVEIVTTGLLSSGTAIANAATSTLSTNFTMWEGSTNHIVIPILARYCNIENISVSAGKLNITVRNTSGASHTLSASFQIIYYKYK